MRNYHVSTSYKPHTTLRRLLVHPKDKIAKDEKCEVVYKIPCHNCDKSYIGETGRQFQVRREEHVSDIDGHDSGVRTRSERVSTSGIHHKSAMTDHATELNHTPIGTSQNFWRKNPSSSTVRSVRPSGSAVYPTTTEWTGLIYYHQLTTTSSGPRTPGGAKDNQLIQAHFRFLLLLHHLAGVIQIYYHNRSDDGA